MVSINDPDVRDMIAQVEGQLWLAQDAYAELEAGRLTEDTSVAHAQLLYKRHKSAPDQDPAHTLVYGAIIYGAGGWNRYYVTHSGEVVFSASHSNGGGIEKAEQVGFRIWR